MNLSAADFQNDVCFLREKHLFRFRAAAIIIRDGCVLMAANNSDSYLYSVGGAVQLGETAEDAVIREVKEETGLDLKISRLLIIHQNFFVEESGDENWHELAFYYLMANGGTETLHCNSKNMTGSKEYLRWIPIETYENHHAFPTFFKDLRALLETSSVTVINSRES